MEKESGMERDCVSIAGNLRRKMIQKTVRVKIELDSG
jgi:hypothetical protein